MHIMLQPVIAMPLLHSAMAHGVGFLARFWTVYPESTIGTRLYHEGNLKEHPAAQTYAARIRALLDKDYPLKGNSQNELNPTSLTLTAKAKLRWVQFHDSTEKGLAKGKLYASIRAFGAKAAEHVLRLAGVLTLVSQPEASEIQYDALEAAITLVTYYLDEWRRLTSIGTDKPEMVRAERLLEWAQKQDAVKDDDGQEHRYLYTQRVYQYGPGDIRDKATALNTIRTLEEHHWLVRIPSGMKIEGKHRPDVWEVRSAPKQA
jgi:hypothetical protein